MALSVTRKCKVLIKSRSSFVHVKHFAYSGINYMISNITSRNHILAITQLKRYSHSKSNHKSPKLNTLLKDHITSKSPTKALSLFRSIPNKRASSVDSFTLNFALKACIMRSSQFEGKQIHAVIFNLGFNRVIFLQTTLIHLYSASGNIKDAHQVFDEVDCKNAVCWTALISAYMNNGKPNEALKLFREMQVGDVEPDQVTVTVALSACASLGTLEIGQQIHEYVCCKQGFEVDLCLSNALINMYVKCGDISAARRIFDRLSGRDVTTWTSMIVGHALHGDASEALKHFAEMEKSCRNGSVMPNDVTFIGVLMACSHAGMVEEGWWYFKSMKKRYGIKPRISHYGCMVDLLCRAGLLQEAYEFIENMPIKPNAVAWRTLLGACSLRGFVELGAIVRKKLVELDPTYVGDDVTMSNTYASVGMWEEKIAVRAHMKYRRAPGCSLIELEDGVHRFVAADKSNLLCKEGCEVLQLMTKTEDL